jgi:hypothetical protein
MLLRLVIVSVLVVTSDSLLAASPKQHPVNPADLTALIDRADEVVVDLMERLNPTIVYSSSDAKDLSELKQALTIEVHEGELHCLCLPVMRIHFFRRSKELGTLLVYPDALTIGFSRWSSDTRIADKEKWLRWFDVRKINGPRQAAEEKEASEKRDRADEERWVSAMPPSLRPLWPKVADVFPGQPVDTKPLSQALDKEFPDANKRVLALMSWFGSGAGAWSGFPMYESVPEQMLLEYPTTDLVGAVQGAALSEQEQEGAARLFAGWEFNQKRPQDIRLVPTDVRHMLLEHSLKSTDEDKLGRAHQAFDPKP